MREPRPNPTVRARVRNWMTAVCQSINLDCGIPEVYRESHRLGRPVSAFFQNGQVVRDPWMATTRNMIVPWDITASGGMVFVAVDHIGGRASGWESENPRRHLWATFAAGLLQIPQKCFQHAQVKAPKRQAGLGV
jgi:hypothetical protein